MNDNNKLSTFFGNCAMSRLLDYLLDNPDEELSADDLMSREGADLSTKSIWTNMPYLVENGMVLERPSGYYKNYQLNTENELIKQISKFRDILVINNVQRRKYERKQQPDKKKSNRQVNIKSKQQKQGRPRQSKNAGRIV